jgi:hypothetical protein
MRRARRTFLLALLCLLILGAAAWIVQRARAEEKPGRQTTIIVPYTEYEWWLLDWQKNKVRCRVLTDHEGIPTSGDILKSCGETIQLAWLNTPSCNKITKNQGRIQSCHGLYLLQISSQPKKKEIVIDLPESSAWVTLQGCTPTPPQNLCQQLPQLLITGEEPLANERITSVEGIFNGQPFACDGSSCALQLSTTTSQGIGVEFWANSSYGDSSVHYTAHVRVIETGVSLTPGTSGWHVDVLSSQWKGASLASCSQTWGAFPPVGGSVEWLNTPDHFELLATDEAYYYLAGRLISQGVVDATGCPSTGLLPNGYADACGLEAAAPLVMAWQNQFDERIIEVAKETGVPAQLMKNLFAQESQFWPGIFKVPYEFGLGQITDKGADTILLWNPNLFDQFCPQVLAQDSCDQGYLALPADAQAMVRGALANQAKSDCTECAQGVDLTNAGVSVNLFANTLLASCEQVAQTVYNATQKIPGEVSTYEDLWRFTLANYHAGPGCVSYAIYTAWLNKPVQLTWDDVSLQFTEACQGVVPYVDKISGSASLLPTPTVSVPAAPAVPIPPIPTASTTPYP